MSETLWHAEDVVRAVRGAVLHEQAWTAQGVSIDSRTARKGDLFIALQGPNNDGHEFVASAFASGAAAAIVSRQPLNLKPGVPLLFVQDTFEALQDLARAARARARGKIIAITGSIGKTTTKEMLRLCLSAVGKTFACPSSYNNKYGLPVSLANLPPDADFGVFELGMSHAGELSPLARLAAPDVAVITGVEAVHLANFASLDAIADAKAEILEGLKKDGVFIVNKDIPQFARLSAAAKSKGFKKTVTFSEIGHADAFLRKCVLTEENSFANVVVAGRQLSYTIPAPGKHLVKNALAALLAAFAASGKIEEPASALSLYEPGEGRGDADILDLPEGPLMVIDESSNSSPVSVRAAIQVLSQHIPRHRGRRILILGEMPDLGLMSPDLHLALVPEIVLGRIDLVFCFGDATRYLYDALPPDLRGGYDPDGDQLAAMVANYVNANDIVVVKGQRTALQEILDALRGLSADPSRKKINA
ncbi:MAG: UDP-N-acetylmuramoyl-tripeptide--D-alanyl-D-alanine ligase [Alphaproteobacteria bacterium]|nr:UDP-N-acetylmuramoyl-tripeptide--D-alanyl-D-alanine ligase [Alphaproteobacteria bacterium]